MISHTMTSLCISLFFLFLFLLPKQVEDIAEVLFHDEADTLGVETGLGKIAVVGLIINLDGKVAVGKEEVANVEVADEVGVGGVDIIAITKLSVDQKAVVEKASVHRAFIFGVVPSLIACGDVGAEIPVVVLDDSVENTAYLRGDGAGE